MAGALGGGRRRGRGNLAVWGTRRAVRRQTRTLLVGILSLPKEKNVFFLVRQEVYEEGSKRYSLLLFVGRKYKCMHINAHVPSFSVHAQTRTIQVITYNHVYLSFLSVSV